MPKVKCSVTNCVFWDEGNNCGAEMILIDINEHADVSFEGEFAVEDFIDHQDEAMMSSGTCCHTFKPKS